MALAACPTPGIIARPAFTLPMSSTDVSQSSSVLPSLSSSSGPPLKACAIISAIMFGTRKPSTKM